MFVTDVMTITDCSWLLVAGRQTTNIGDHQLQLVALYTKENVDVGKFGSTSSPKPKYEGPEGIEQPNQELNLGLPCFETSTYNRPIQSPSHH